MPNFIVSVIANLQTLNPEHTGKPIVCWSSGIGVARRARHPNWNATDDENDDNKAYYFFSFTLF